MATEQETAQQVEPHGRPHPEPSEYVKVAIILAIVTAIEVAFYYLEGTGLSTNVIVVALIVLMVVKFAMVGLWFMHLRFDSPLFRRLFIVGIVLAMAIYTAVLLMFGVLIGR